MNRRGFIGLFGIAAAVSTAPVAAFTAPILVGASKARKPITVNLRAEKGGALTFEELDDNFRRIAERVNELSRERQPRLWEGR